MIEIPPDLVSALTDNPALIVAGHVTPDADCVGSMLALAWGVEQATGREVRCALPEGSLSKKLEFLADLTPVKLATLRHCLDADVLVVCDTAKQQRVNLPGGAREQLPAGLRIINIDHHASSTRFGEINYVDDQASSASELVYRIFKHAGWDLTPAIATLLSTGMHADTVGFSLPSTTAVTFDAAADLVRNGADIGLIGDRLWRCQSREEFQLRRVVYDNTKLSKSGKIAYSTATYQEITESGCTAADIDDQVEIPRSLAGASIAILFTEGNQGRVRINLRSKTQRGVLELARCIGGGGHRQAAGAIMTGTIEDAVSKLLPLADAYLDEQEVN